jgi:hypothetical protein
MSETGAAKLLLLAAIAVTAALMPMKILRVLSISTSRQIIVSISRALLSAHGVTFTDSCKSAGSHCCNAADDSLPAAMQQGMS